MVRPKVFVTRIIDREALDTIAGNTEMEVWPDEFPPSAGALREKNSTTPKRRNTRSIGTIHHHFCAHINPQNCRMSQKRPLDRPTPCVISACTCLECFYRLGWGVSLRYGFTVR